jgi:putative ABC transport system permease protein
MLRIHLKLALKVLLRRKVHTAISLFGISFTLLALILVAALADHAAGPVGPEKRQDRILISSGGVEDLTGETRQGRSLGPRLLERFFADLPGAEAMAIFFMPVRVRAFREGVRFDLGLKRTDGGFWTVLQFEFIEGGPYGAEEVREARPVAVINESTRGKLFDGAPALGRWLELEGQRFRVVGVVRDASPLRRNPWSDVWVPLTTSRLGEHLSDVGGGGDALVLARSRADFPRIKQEAELRAARYDPPDPTRHGRVHVSMETSFEKIVEELADGLVDRRGRDGQTVRISKLAGVALIISLVFMLLPAVNLINLNVSRILERASEIGVRKAFGASSRALVGQFVVENVVLTAVGGALALLLSTLVLHRVSATGLFGAEPLQVSYRVFLVGMALALIFGLVSGVYPAWKMARMHPLAALRGALR